MQKKFIYNKLSQRFIFPVLLVMLLDGGFTLLGQPDAYWINTALVNEASQIGRYFLTVHPVIFVVLFVVYLFIAYLLLKKLSVFWASVVGLSLFLGHAWGSSSWIYPLYNKLGFTAGEFTQWNITIVYFILLSFITSFFIFSKKVK